ncbi:hypothetical protein KY290_025165 [Solanum tuberosum]|uniref:Uncharacterized protein n=1 Tax=Solanum tuberosum TaxID=4113 RepID=A0ABQ7USU5_SOLTU|nr:hypothetical protein KY284_023969 [Solanum tuberosum]KAH0754895.1 hypothetical protein KY290_025165 [Solanum tuberosum]
MAVWVMTETLILNPIKSTDATYEEIKANDKRFEDDEMTRGYILASKVNVLQHQHQSMIFSYDMLGYLKEMFRE